MKDEELKLCAYCHRDINGIESNKPNDFTGTMYETGRAIFHAILDGRFRSIDLCNWDYTLLQMFRHSLEPKKILTEQEKAEYAERLMRMTKVSPSVKDLKRC